MQIESPIKFCPPYKGLTYSCSSTHSHVYMIHTYMSSFCWRSSSGSSWRSSSSAWSRWRCTSWIVRCSSGQWERRKPSIHCCCCTCTSPAILPRYCNTHCNAQCPTAMHNAKCKVHCKSHPSTAAAEIVLPCNSTSMYFNAQYKTQKTPIHCYCCCCTCTCTSTPPCNSTPLLQYTMHNVKCTMQKPSIHFWNCTSPPSLQCNAILPPCNAEYVYVCIFASHEILLYIYFCIFVSQ